ncbi:tagaturonate reductase [Saccharibacillus sp. CPCC 101409]|uniref:tagaturonate reductase n=1 Tax=Saccharibacillus sp. CPCC 101409 TaxID=3058041 RepID=UPI0026731A3D|nr:tagaturonate reductase [Saccharibacillus sp. CPCC 101409]MDO3410790.1 tagaturonate reductase [Saccharibacillus sp. CPCC 101409]
MEKLNERIHTRGSRYPEKVLQYGEGNFMRAFVDWQIDEMNKKAGFGGSVAMLQPLPAGRAEGINEQDGLYTLYLQGIKDGRAVKEHSLIECVSRGIDPYSNYEAYIALAEQPELRFVVSNTTEAGIAFDPSDTKEGRPQSSYPGKLTAFLYRRYRAFGGDASKGMIVIPCELIDRNGDKLKQFVLQYAELWQLEAGFTEWIETANTFCSSLVDRIVTGYPADSIDEITAELGYLDDYVVVGEQFHLWVIEGPGWLKEEFPAHLAGLNVKIVDDMTPYRTRKVRILNGAHSALTPVAYLYGLNTVGESVEHPEVGAFVRGLIGEEIAPMLDLPEEERRSFSEDVLERFANPYVQHYLTSISLNSMSKFKTRDLPTLLEYAQRRGELPPRLTFALAALIRFYRGDRGEERIPLSDDAFVLERFEQLWGACGGSDEELRALTASVLGFTEVWEMDLNAVSGLTEAVSDALIRIERLGMREAVRSLIAAPSANGSR